MPDIFFASKEEAPDGLRETLIDSGDGRFKINVVPNSKLVEFRDNNTNLLKERDTLKATVDKYAPVIGDDPEAFLTEVVGLRTTQQQVNDGKLKGTEDIQKTVDGRVSALEDGYKSQLSEAATKIQNLTEYGQSMTSKYQSSVRDREITNAVLAEDSGANPQALPDILQRAQALFHVEDDGSLTPKQGDTIIYGADASSPMTPNEWLGKLLETAPYLGKASAGGGAAGERGGEKFGGMSEKDFNAMTPQQRLARHRQGQKKRA